jgi:RNA polymerase sigma-70 factor (ECF subfamily)
MEAVLDSTPFPLGTSLVDAARRGDRDSFRALVEPHLPAALGAATVLTGSGADAADAVQDALLSAWRSLDSLRDPDAFPAWFRRQVIRSAIRIAQRRPRVVELDLSTAASPPLTSEGDLERSVERRLLIRAFDRLDPADRVVLTLHYFWDLPTAESAQLLAVPVGTVKSRVHYALERLRAAYGAEERR